MYCVDRLNDLNHKEEATREVDIIVENNLQEVSTVLLVEVVCIVFLPKQTLKQVQDSEKWVELGLKVENSKFRI